MVYGPHTPDTRAQMLAALGAESVDASSSMTSPQAVRADGSWTCPSRSPS